MATFSELVTSRKHWVETVLRPWCVQASRKDLLEAEAQWSDIAGQVDPADTLWTWAWSRFPDLVHEGLSGVNETLEVQVTLKDGTTILGYPDARRTCQGRLMLVRSAAEQSTPDSESGPHSIDDVVSVKKV